MSVLKAPKPWRLTEEETFASFTSWKHNLVFVLNSEPSFQPFLKPAVEWQKLSPRNPSRGFVDGEGDNGLTKEVQAANLQQMLGLITQWVPHYISTDITNNSTSMDSVWAFIRKYYGFQASETQFMRFSAITWQEGERPERLYQRVLAHLQDNLLTTGTKLRHNGQFPTSDEELSPTVERLAVLRWMELLHPSLPTLVQRTFAYDLQRMTLKDLQPQIADSLDGFLEELRQDEVKVSRVFNSRRSGPREDRFKKKKPVPQCRLCKAEGRTFLGHSITTCHYISKAEKQDLIRSFKVDIVEHATQEFEELDIEENNSE